MNTEELRRQIERSDLKAAAESLVRMFEQIYHSGPYVNESRVLASRVANLERDFRRGQITQQQANVQRNQIGFAMLDLLDDAGEQTPSASASVFISYRRDHGATVARAVRLALKDHGIESFLDVEDLGAGAFGPALLEHIDQADAVVLILSQGALDRCGDQADWVRTEIGHALTTGKFVVALRMPGFTMPDDLPPDLEKLSQQNGVSYSHEFFDATIERLIELISSER